MQTNEASKGKTCADAKIKSALRSISLLFLPNTSCPSKREEGATGENRECTQPKESHNMGAIPGGCDTNNPKPAGTVSLLGEWPYTASSTTCLQVLAQCFDSENARLGARSGKSHASLQCTLCNLGRDCDQGVASLFNNEPFATGSSLFRVFPHDPSYNKGLRANSG